MPKEIWFETQSMYQAVHQPFVDVQKRHLGWVYNILEKNREKCNEIDRIIFEDSDASNGFMVLPDLKWDQKDNRELDLLLLVNRRDLHTVRDLNETHLSLLNNIVESVPKLLSKKFSIAVNIQIIVLTKWNILFEGERIATILSLPTVTLPSPPSYYINQCFCGMSNGARNSATRCYRKYSIVVWLLRQTNTATVGSSRSKVAFVIKRNEIELYSFWCVFDSNCLKLSPPVAS